MDWLKDAVGQEPPWTRMGGYDIVICNKRQMRLGESLENTTCEAGGTETIQEILGVDHLWCRQRTL